MKLLKYIFIYKKEGSIFFGLLFFALISGLFINDILGLIIALLAVVYFGLGLYAAVLDYPADKENFELRMADEWATQGDSPEEIRRRQELLASHGPSFVYDEYIHAVGGPTFDDYMSSPSSFESLNDIPIFDLSSPFNASYGTGTSAYEMATGTDLSNNSN